MPHHECLMKAGLVQEIIAYHALDHRQLEECYKMLGSIFYPVVRETVQLLLKEHVQCDLCVKASAHTKDISPTPHHQVSASTLAIDLQPRNQVCLYDCENPTLFWESTKRPY